MASLPQAKKPSHQNMRIPLACSGVGTTSMG